MTAPLPRDLERILVFCPSWIGDTVMATPVFRALRRHAPGARITAATRAGIDDLLAGSNSIDAFVRIDMSGLTGPARSARALRAARPQAVLLLPNSFRSALTARLTGAPIRIGYDRDHRGRLLTNRVAAAKTTAPTPAVDYYATLAAFACAVESIDTRIELEVGDAEREAASAILAEIHGPFALLNPGANRPDKRWPALRFARLADALATAHGLAIVASGAPGEKDLIAEISRAAEVPVLDLARRGIDLSALKAIIERAALLVTNDTGPRHIAAALGTPVVSLFGPTDHRWTTLRISHERVVLAEPFLPEELVADRHPKLCAMSRISVGDVLAAASSLLLATSA